jgi:hypothetical protein
MQGRALKIPEQTERHLGTQVRPSTDIRRELASYTAICRGPTRRFDQSSHQIASRIPAMMADRSRRADLEVYGVHAASIQPARRHCLFRANVCLELRCHPAARDSASLSHCRTCSLASYWMAELPAGSRTGIADRRSSHLSCVPPLLFWPPLLESSATRLDVFPDSDCKKKNQP